MPNNHLPTQTAVIKALTKLLGGTEAVFPGHKISSHPGLYVTQGLRSVSGPVVLVRGRGLNTSVQTTEDLAALLTEKGFEIARNPKRSTEITVNYIPREAR